MNRTEALTAVLQDPNRSDAEKEIAARALRSRTNADVRELVSATIPYQELSADSQAMLHSLGKKHLSEINEDEFARYAHQFNPSFKQALCRQWRAWVCPGDDMLLSDWDVAGGLLEDGLRREE